ncbi:MAG TPA: 50S ribosomal protein L28 [Coxiellaceae bacterium]|nr:MAG: 50S ribosomal protein L28 [Gammaproteobacteria bacterium RBG_16_37_9]HBC71218.1 50S ribosomal protein L28 [Coxiellaceae bacterium]
MSQVCHITGKRPKIGNKVSHANKKSKRRFNINLHSKRFWLEEQKRFIKLRVSTQGLRIIDKVGIEKVLENLSKYKNEIEG